MIKTILFVGLLWSASALANPEACPKLEGTYECPAYGIHMKFYVDLRDYKGHPLFSIQSEESLEVYMVTNVARKTDLWNSKDQVIGWDSTHISCQNNELIRLSEGAVKDDGENFAWNSKLRIFLDSKTGALITEESVEAGSDGDLEKSLHRTECRSFN